MYVHVKIILAEIMELALYIFEVTYVNVKQALLVDRVRLVDILEGVLTVC
jgi:hypothetical protein